MNRHPRPGDRPGSHRRALRPIGVNAADVTARTGRLLAEAARRGGAEVFTDVVVDTGQAPIAHVVSAERLLLLVESVAWPPGSYATTLDGGVLCDGAYIGQSVRPLVGAVRRIQRATAGRHRVGALVVVHPSLPAAPDLPATGPAELSWLPPGDLVSQLTVTLCQSDINMLR